jgi:parvulin-like peptidyl-prolyl isomerase
MTFDRLRRRMKAIIWLITILFVGSTFLFAGGSLCIKSPREEEEERDRAAGRRGRDRDGDRDDPAAAKRGKDDLDPTASSVLVTIALGGREARITEGEFNEQLNQQVRFSPYFKGMKPRDLKPLLGKNMLEQLVSTRLAEMAAESQKIDVSSVEKQVDAELAQPETQRELSRRGILRQTYRSERIRSARLRKLMAQVTEGAQVPEERIRAYYELKKDEFKDATTKVPRTLEQVRREIERTLRSSIPDDAQAVRSYYETHRERWRHPDRLQVRHLVVNPAAAAHARDLSVAAQEITTYYESHKAEFVGEPRMVLRHVRVDPAAEAFTARVKPTDADLATYFAANKADYARPEKAWLARITLHAPPNATEAERKRIEGRTRDILAQLRKGASFEALARKHSDDKKSAARGGDLGAPIERGQMSPQFDSAAFALKPGELSDVVADEDGCHILKLARREDRSTPAFPEVAADVRKRWVAEKAKELATKEMEDVAAEAKARPGEFEKLAANRSHAPSKTRGGLIGELALGANRDNASVDEVGTHGYMDQEVIDALEKLKQGDVSGVVKSALGLHVFRVDKTLPGRSRPLDDVREEVATAIKRQKTDQIGFKLSVAIRDELRGGVPFEKLVDRYSDGKDRSARGLWDGVVLSEEPQALTSDVLADVGGGPGLPAAIVSALRELAPGQVSAPVNHDTKTHFFHVVRQLPPRYRDLDAEVRKEIRFALNPTVSSDEVQKYYEAHKSEFSTRGRTSAEFIAFRDEDTAIATMEEIAKNPKVFAEHPDKSVVSGEVRNPEIRAILGSLAPGKMTPKPVKTRAGWIVARLDKQEAAGDPPLAQVESRVREKLLAERKEQLYDQWLSELKNQARIKRMPVAASI